MMRYRAAASAAILFLLLGCATGPEKTPEAPDAVFDESRYMTASGLGATEAEARREAMGALAAVFESKVYSETASEAASFMTESAPEAFEKNVETKLRIESSVRLQGARIGSVGRDAESGLFRAIAVLDRQQAARQWYDQMAMVDARMQAERAALPALSGRLNRLAALNRILEAALEKAALRSRLRVVGRAATGPEADDLQPIADEAAALRAGFAFLVEVEGTRADAVSDRIEQALGVQGLGVTRNPAQAAGRVSGTVEVAPLKLGNRKIRFVRATLRLSVVDVDTATQVGAISEDVRKGHVDENEAIRMATDAVSDRAAAVLLETLGLRGFLEPGPA
jgi:hypothetical protein